MNQLLCNNYHPAYLFGQLPVLKLRFNVTVESRNALPQFLGSAWRGLMGWELQRLICPFPGKRPCPECIIRQQCPYFLLIEEPPRPQILSDAPRGYVLYPWDDTSSEQIKLDLTLFGAATKFLPVLVMALLNGRKTGLGIQQIPYQIVSAVELLPDQTESPLPLAAEKLLAVKGPFPLTSWLNRISFRTNTKVRLTTPVRLRKQGKYINPMNWMFFFSTLIRRLEGLNVLYNNGLPLGKECWHDLQQKLSGLEQLSAKVKWEDKSRYSNRQKCKVPMGGLTGEINLEQFPDWLTPWWQATNITHIGKGAAMGWGKIDFV